MKRIILEPKAQKTVNLKDIQYDSVVGIEWKDNKSIIIYDSRGYFSLNNEKTDLNSSWLENDIISYIKRASKQNATFFVFDSVKECFEWMSK